MLSSLFLTLVVLFTSSTDTTSALFWRNDCPKLTPPADFDLDEYVKQTWYIQKQQPISYLPESDFYCVAATYDLEGKKQWFREAVSVRNYASRDRINNSNNAGNFTLCATRFDPDDEPAKLMVSPCFLPPRLGGPYWIVAVADDYSWAIVTGGQPDREGECGEESGLCTTASGSRFTLLGNDQGLWFFTRAQVADELTMLAMEAKALELGICTAGMKDVVQEGCLYEGAVIKD